MILLKDYNNSEPPRPPPPQLLARMNINQYESLFCW